MSHVCHALGCTVEVPEHIFMHREHWYMVPKPLRDAIWRTYRRGQEVTKTPSKEYIAAATAAVAAVTLKEGKAMTQEGNGMRCRLCGKSALEIQGWLCRVNEKGVAGIWECRPHCDVTMDRDAAVLGAIEAEEEY